MARAVVASGRLALVEDTLSMTPSDAPVPLFCGYHPEDRKYFEGLCRHLVPFVRGNRLTIRDSGCAPAGPGWTAAIEKELSEARVIVLLVSEYLTSEDDWWDLLNSAARASHEKRAELVLVLVRKVELSNTPLKDLQILPRATESPLEICSDISGTLTTITKEIGDIVLEIQQRARALPVSGAAMAESAKSALDGVQSRKDRAYNLKYQGRGTDALKELHVALKELNILIETDPADTSLKKERAHLYDRIAQCEYAQGRFITARAAFDRAFEIRLDLCLYHSGDVDVRFDLSTSHFWRGYLSYLLGELARARDEQQAGLMVCQDLYGRDAGNLKAARSLVVLQTDLGTTSWELGDVTGGERHLRDAVAFGRMLAAQKPDNRQIQRDVGVGQFRLSDLLLARGETEEATRLCEESILMCWKLTEWDPTNVQWRRHLATARISMGDVRVSRDDLTRARGDYEFATGTMGALATVEGDDRQGARHHARAEKRLGDLLYRAGDHAAAKAALARATSAMKTACAGEANERWQRELLEIEMALSRAPAPGAAHVAT